MGAGQSSTGKRRREDELPFSEAADEESAAKRRAKLAQDVLFRVVVPSRQIGKVIGKEGCRIQKIREDTKATIKIADAVAVGSFYFYISFRRRNFQCSQVGGSEIVCFFLGNYSVSIPWTWKLETL